jgi:hypothetical protein
METNVDILFLAIGVALYYWGKKRGKLEGKRVAYEEERLYRLEEKVDEMCYNKAKGG